MSSFINAMNNRTQMVLNEKGALAHPTSGEDLRAAQVDIIYKMVRGLPHEEIVTLLEKACKHVKTPDDVADMFVLCFHCRSTRNLGGGKGERKLFFDFFAFLCKKFPARAVQMVDLIPHYGRWKDLIELLNFVEKGKVQKRIIGHYAETLRKEYVSTLLDDGYTTNNLAAKWAPRENKCFHKAQKQKEHNLFDMLVMATESGKIKSAFPTINREALEYIYNGNIKGTEGAPSLKEWCSLTEKNMATEYTVNYKKYRQMLGKIMERMYLTETELSNGNFDGINFDRTPAGALMKYTSAFLNELPNEECSLENGNRHPDNEKRIACRQRFMEYITNKELKQTNIDLVVLVGKITRAGHGNLTLAPMSTAKRNLYEKMYTKYLSTLLDGDKPMVATFLPMVDVSGSMYGPEICIAMAFGIILSDLLGMRKSPFANRALTFDSKPEWVSLLGPSEKAEDVDFEGSGNFCNNLKRLMNAGWGTSTDFLRAFELMRGVICAEKVAPTEVPDWIVCFSDMQFDQSFLGMERNGVQTTLETLRDEWESLNKLDWVKKKGWEYQLPGIIFWNLRSTTLDCGVPAKSEDKGIVLWSGYSPAVLKTLLFNDIMKERETVDPTAALNLVLQHPDFSQIRERIVKE